MNSQMIIHHPYRTLQSLQETLHMGPDDVSLAWSIINDHYLTDLPLLYPPHTIALTAIFLALTTRPSIFTPQADVVAPKLVTDIEASSQCGRIQLFIKESLA